MHSFYFIKRKMHTLDNYTLKGYALNHMPVWNWKKETNGGPSILFNTTKVFNAKTHSHSASALDPAEVNFRLHRIQTHWSSNSGKHLFTFYCSSFSLSRGLLEFSPVQILLVIILKQESIFTCLFSLYSQFLYRGYQKGVYIWQASSFHFPLKKHML